jgi:AraC-like DNA-binding protein
MQKKEGRILPASYKGVSVSFVYPIVRTMVMKGIDKTDFLRKANIEESLLLNTEARLPEEDFERLTELAAALTEDDAFGLHQGTYMEVSDLGVLGYVMLHSKTIRHALAAYQKYNVIVCNAFNISLEEEGEGDDVTLEISFQDPDPDPRSSFYPHQSPSRHCMEDMASSLYHLMIKLSCRPISLKEVHFTHGAPLVIDEYASVLGVTPQFGQASNRLRISKGVLEYPILFADAKLLGTFEAIADEARQRLLQGRAFTDQLYNWIMQSMPTYIPSLKDTAKAFHMSIRSIQAKLAQEHTTYQDIVNRVRKELAVGYLAKPEYKIGEVAYLLHFSEPSAFQSAFKKWTGVTPRQYRMDAL